MPALPKLILFPSPQNTKSLFKRLGAMKMKRSDYRFHEMAKKSTPRQAKYAEEAGMIADVLAARGRVRRGPRGTRVTTAALPQDCIIARYQIGRNLERYEVRFRWRGQMKTALVTERMRSDGACRLVFRRDGRWESVLGMTAAEIYNEEEAKVNEKLYTKLYERYAETIEELSKKSRVHRWLSVITQAIRPLLPMFLVFPSGLFSGDVLFRVSLES
jgi:hypothetical protein